MARATSVLHQEVIDEAGNIIELAIWRLPAASAERVRYRLLYDNHPLHGRREQGEEASVMAKRLTIEIRPMDHALKEFAETFRSTATGRRVRRVDGVYFTSIEAARNLLTPSRLALLRAIRASKPASIYELAKLLGRDLKNVQSDLQLLERYDVVRMSHGRGTGRRKVRTPTTPFSEIALRIAI